MFPHKFFFILFQSIYVYMYLSTYLFIYLSTYSSIYLSIYISISPGWPAVDDEEGRDPDAEPEALGQVKEEAGRHGRLLQDR